MLPAHVCRLHFVVVQCVPKLIYEEVTTLVNETYTLNVATLAILADVNVGEAASTVNIMLLIVLLSCITRTHIRTRHLIREVKAETIQVRRGSDLNPY